MAHLVLTGSPAEAAKVGEKFQVKGQHPVTVILHGSPGANTIAIQQSGDDGTTWVAATDGYGTAMSLTAANKTVPIFRAGTYRPSLGGSPANTISVYLATDMDP
jgi:hypothetical protein